MTPEVMRALVDRYIDAYNRMDVEAMMAVMHPDVVFTNLRSGRVDVQTNGAAELERLARESVRLFTERHQAIRAFTVTGDTAEAEIAFQGVLAGDSPADSRVIKLRGRTRFTFAEGALIRIIDIS